MSEMSVPLWMLSALRYAYLRFLAYFTFFHNFDMPAGFHMVQWFTWWFYSPISYFPSLVMPILLQIAAAFELQVGEGNFHLGSVLGRLI